MSKEEKTLKFDFPTFEKEMIEFWEENDSLNKLMKKNEGKKRFRFLDGPITANNSMGIHHLWGRTLKDLYIKYKSMKGFSTHFINGFDAHGTPVEVNVEKELGIKNKKELNEYGIGKFVDKCLERVDKFSKIQTSESIRLGQWMDWENSYYTNSDSNITSIWHFLRKCHDKKWLKLSTKPMMWCPRCGTSLSDHEMTGSYKELEHDAVFIKLPLIGSTDKILVWTTTPWTLSSNVALAVNPSIKYIKAKVKSDSSNIILAKEAKAVLKDDLVEIIDEFNGKELLGNEYETCFNNLKVQDFKHNIIAWEDVQADEGTGVVHIAPGCGQEDYELGEKLNLRKIGPINESGEFTKEFGFLEGLDVTKAKEVIFDRLKQENKFYYVHKYKHNYPVCWRCKAEIVFRLIDSWCIDVDEIRPRLIEETKKVKWEPEYLEKSMVDWLENMGEWHISRSRFYGIPLPIYHCADCGHVNVIGSLDELKQRVSKGNVSEVPHLHRPYIDEVEIECEKCSASVKRITDVGDTWLDAGITPFSTLKYFDDKKYWRENFPAEAVIEMKEQVRLWFYSLLFMSVTLEDKAPYEKVIGHSAVIKEDGGKFSKSGYMIKVSDVANNAGLDPARYLYASASINNDVRFGYNLIEEVKRKLLSLWNAFTFFDTYASIDNPNIGDYKPDYSKLNLSDKWLVKMTNEFVKSATINLDSYKVFNVVKDFEVFVDKLTNFYIRVNRRRFWKEGNEIDKSNAYWTLYNALKSIIQVMAPIIPFTAEYIWQNLVVKYESNAPESVILSDFPDEILKVSDDEILNSVDFATKVISVGQRLRAESQIKVKQPLDAIYLNTSKGNLKHINSLSEIIKSELNIKAIKTFESDSKFYVPYLVLDFAKAGKFLKKDVQEVKRLIDELQDDQMLNLVDMYKKGKIDIGNFKGLDSNLFIKKYSADERYAISNEKDYIIVLDKKMNPLLKEEGQLRELIRALQVLRKDTGFRIDDRINANISSKNKAGEVLINKYYDKIKSEVLINNLNSLEIIKPLTDKKINVDDIVFKISLAKN